MLRQTESYEPTTYDYTLLSEQVRALAQGERGWLGVCANVSALLFEALTNVNWVGFYLVDVGGDDAPSLVLGPFQGKIACSRIPFGKGVCGTAAAMDETQCVANVHEFTGHIACDITSNSEIVLPLHAQGAVVGVLDIDSSVISRFTHSDQVGLEAVVRTIEAVVDLSSLPFS